MINKFRRYIKRDKVNYLDTEDLKRGFKESIIELNYSRLKIWIYFLVFMSAFLLYSDFVFADIWGSVQAYRFMVLDIILGLVVLIQLLSFYCVKLIKSSSIRKRIKTFQIHFYIIFHLVWGASVSIIESETANNVPTYLIGVLSLATIFIVPKRLSAIYLSLSYLYLIFGFNAVGVGLDVFVQKYFASFLLIAISWVLTTVIYNTRVKNFHFIKKLEEAKADLDNKVQDRTQKLRYTNKRLMDEIHERKNFEKQLKHEKKLATEADRLKSVFLANMSHEIRTPLNGVMGFSELLSKDNLTKAKREKYTSLIRSNSDQLLKLIDDILDISMIESNQLKLNLFEFDLVEMINQTFSEFKNSDDILQQKDIKLFNVWDEKSDRPLIYSDKVRVKQIINNLLSNAIKFTKEGHVRIGGRIDEEYALVYVEDTGKGVGQEICRTVFDRFRQGEEHMNRNYGGSGLGLSICKGIVDILGGYIWIDFSYTKGAKFCFTFPIKKSYSPILHSTNSKENNNIIVGKKILFVDQSTPMLPCMEKIGYDFKVNILSIALENFLAVSDIDIEPDCVVFYVTDIDIFLEKVKDNSSYLFADKPNIVVCANKFEAKTLYERGYLDTIYKPMNICQLFTRVSNLMTVNLFKA